MKKVEFKWNIKEKPEDFIVKEVAEHRFDPKGQHYLYILEKKNLNTNDIAKELGFSYAGLKDKTGITRQFVSFESFVGDIIEKVEEDRYYKLIFLGRVRKKVKLGRLKGNIFEIDLKGKDIKPQNWFINYYDIQRLKNNYNRGRDILKKVRDDKKTRKDLSWLENFLIDSYLSYLWNKSLEEFLKEKFNGFYVVDNDIEFFIPEISYEEIKRKVPKYWTLAGYKVDFEYSKDYYKKVLEREGFSLKELVNTLKTLRIKGDYRKSYVNVENLKIENGKISFFLPKGSYATMFLKHIYKGENND